jgi:hypothetical protein
MHRLGIEFGGERNHLVARQAARPVLEDAAGREVFKMKLWHEGGLSVRLAISNQRFSPLETVPRGASTGAALFRRNNGANWTRLSIHDYS